jgi:tRNA(adenine34) deaminase
MSEQLRSELEALRAEAATFGGGTDDPSADPGVVAVLEAIDAGLEGNAAVGAVLVGPDGTIVRTDRNRMFSPYFRSDFHAEMVLLTGFEDEHRDAELRGYTLISSLEPCEMCMIRIINSGVSVGRWVAADLEKGAVSGPNQLAQHWRALAAAQDLGTLDCPPRLAEISLRAFELTIGGVVARLQAPRGRIGTVNVD